MTRDVLTLTARVERIEMSTRSVTLRAADGTTHSVYVGPELEAFRELKAGDTVRVRITESIIVALRPGAKITGPLDTTAAANKAPEADGADVLQQLRAVVTIESVDMAMRTVVYKGADNRRVMRQVQDPALLQNLKPGDVIEITYTRERAIELQRQR